MLKCTRCGELFEMSIFSTRTFDEEIMICPECQEKERQERHDKWYKSLSWFGKIMVKLRGER